MSSIGMNIGLRALLTNQSSLDVIGQNLANANTPGYSRQRVQLGASGSVMRHGLGFGTGVDASMIGRSVDNLLGGRIITKVSDLYSLDAKVTGSVPWYDMVGLNYDNYALQGSMQAEKNDNLYQLYGRPDVWDYERTASPPVDEGH